VTVWSPQWLCAAPANRGGNRIARGYIDGTILRGDRILPAACETIDALRARHINVCFFTNDNRSPIDQWLDRLGAHGISVRPDEMITSAVVAADTIARSCAADKILVAGDLGLVEALQAHGLWLLDWGSDLMADVVVMGKDPHFDQKRLHAVCQHIWNGAKFIATNNDRKMPVADGYIPGPHSNVSAFQQIKPL